MSKTFKSRNADMKNTVVVKSSGGGAHITLTNNDGRLHGCDVSAADAPALALAILEAAGVEVVPADAYAVGSLDQLRDTAYELRRYVNAQAGIAKESAAREALERRRGELAVEYFEGAYGHLQRPAYRRAIDRIIELEDQATKC